MGRETNKQRRERQATTAREKAAAARAVQRRQDQRRRAMAILSSIVAVAVVGVIIAVVVIKSGGGSNSPEGDRTSASPSVVKAVTSVSDATLDQVGEGKVSATPTPVTGQPPLTSNGKPELLYIGAEFCPYCAIERWSLAIALSKFGKLSNLGAVRAATTDGNYASLDFYNPPAKFNYTSDYLTFTPVENEDRNRQPLESLTKAQNALWYKLTNNQPGFPFISFGNKLAYAGSAPLDPTVLAGMDQQEIASKLDDPTSDVMQVIGGGANSDIAAICTMTGNLPSRVCSRPVIKTLQSKFGA